MISWLNLEDEFHRWILEQHEKDMPISKMKIQMKAKKLAWEQGIENFVDGPMWCYRFVKRCNLIIRYHTTMGHSLPTQTGKRNVNSSLNIQK